MKVLFTHGFPFFLAHGGLQTQIEALMRELNGLGVEVEPERWWEAQQRGDIIQYFGRPASAMLLAHARQKNFRTVMFENLDQTASRSRRALWLQRRLTRTASCWLPGMVNRMSWESYQELDGIIYATELEWATAQYLFDAPRAKGVVIGHGLEEKVIAELRQPAPEGDYLISMSTIAERKNSVLLARAARAAQVPVVFLGKPYSKEDSYFREFESLVDQKCVRYPGFVSEAEKQALLRGARGFALLSRFESGCIAVYEAAASGLPLFLSDLPWANRVYHTARQREFVPLGGVEAVAARLKQFYATAHRSTEPTFAVPSWRDVAQQYRQVYERVLAQPIAR